MILVAALAGCEPRYAYDHAHAQILKGRLARTVVVQCKRTPLAIDGAWELDERDIPALEATLVKSLGAALAKLPPQGQKLQAVDYYRQYAGVIVGDRLLVYINGFHETYVRMSLKPDEWRTSPVSVCGGGEWYFGALYDPQQKKIVAFEFNPQG